MSFDLRVRPRARNDIRDAAAWYNTQSIGLGSLFLDEVRRLFLRISENPLLYPEVYRTTRRALLHKFPLASFIVLLTMLYP